MSTLDKEKLADLGRMLFEVIQEVGKQAGGDASQMPSPQTIPQPPPVVTGSAETLGTDGISPADAYLMKMERRARRQGRETSPPDVMDVSQDPSFFPSGIGGIPPAEPLLQAPQPTTFVPPPAEPLPQAPQPATFVPPPASPLVVHTPQSPVVPPEPPQITAAPFELPKPPELPVDPLGNKGPIDDQKRDTFADYGDERKAADLMTQATERTRIFMRNMSDALQKFADTLCDFNSRLCSIERQLETMEETGA